MNYLVIHEHYWENDRHEKGNPEHSSILYVSKNREDAYMRAEQLVALARSARANMEEAMDIIAKETGINRPDTSAFNDQIYLAEAEDAEGMQQNDAAIMHIMAMAFASPEMLSEMMLADMRK